MISTFFEYIFASKHIIFSITRKSEMLIVATSVKVVLKYCNKPS